MDVAAPDTKLAREALAIVGRVESPALLNHSVRTYLLGAAYARARGITHDGEGLYLAALFHDLGLCPEHRDGARAFQLAGSAALRTFLGEQGEAEARGAALGEAIEMHMSLWPRWSRGAEVGLLQVGAWMDLTRLRRWAVRREARAIESAHPRLGIDGEFARRLIGSARSVRAWVGLVVPPRPR